jgi:uncharacterized phage protein (TIGR01671 family)
MRKIIFRGKCWFGQHKWLEGNLYIRNDKYYITPIVGDNVVFTESMRVVPETIGQFTGVLDKNNKEIYEGDIVTDGNTVFTVFWSDGGFCIESNPQSFGYGYQCNSNPSEPLANQQFASWFEGNVVCLGNIHDNPEILKHSND